MKKEKIIFWGTPEVAATCLEHLLLAGYNVVAVVSQPDKPIGRKRIVAPTPTKKIALAANIPVLQPFKLKTEDFALQISAFQPDLCVVVAYGRIIPLDILTIPKFFINLHFSLLPKYRGAAPVQRAILEGQKTTGITVQHLEMELDTGDIIIQKELEIGPDECSPDLLAKATNIGKDELLKAIDLLIDNKAPRYPQIDANASHAAKITKDTGYVDWSLPAQQIYNQFRCCHPWPGLTTSLNGQNIKLKKITLDDCHDSNLLPGLIVIRDKEFKVATGSEFINVLEIQPANKQKMSVEAFLAGQRIPLIKFDKIQLL